MIYKGYFDMSSSSRDTKPLSRDKLIEMLEHNIIEQNYGEVARIRKIARYSGVDLRKK